ncbi:MAG: DNA polymerase III subunit gamma/tau [Verrucomicrobiota bacterium]
MSQELPDVVRDSRAYQVLKRSLDAGRLGHGILLHGENLESLEQIARVISSQLLETDRDPYEHPDCFTLRPSGKARLIKIGSESERSQGEWPRNSMRRLVIDLQKTSNQGGRKVGILFEADRMNVQSANAFLKTLEEPPASTTLFLLTTRPYDLLDTIRSRCLNFRVPSNVESVMHPDWQAWIIEYREWLGLLLKSPTKESIPHMMMATYGLNARFQAILGTLTSEAWKAQKESLPESISDEEKNAMEASLSKGFRRQLLGEIEKVNAAFAREIESANPGRLPAVALNRATQTLEHCTGLLELNFNQAAALELFFLKSLRIWTSVR